MKTEFNKLVEVMQNFDLYRSNDEVDIALKELYNKIDEVEKRMECAVKCNREIDRVVFSFVDAFQDRGVSTQTLNYGDFEILLRGVHDIDIALDLKEDECIENNWYSLFKPKKEVSNGGIPYQHCHHCSIKEEETVMSKVNNFWLCSDCKAEINEVAPTSQCTDSDTWNKVRQVIEILKTLDNGNSVDGETMQYILEQVGMQDQMLRQLVMGNKYVTTSDLLREKFELTL